MKDKTKVKARNVWKVAEVIIKDPNATRREIQKKTKLHPLTIQKAKQEMNQNWTKDPIIAYIVNASKERIKRASALFDRFIYEVETKEELSRSDTQLIKEIVKDDMARVNVLWWNVTDSDWWFKEIVVKIPE